MAPQLLITEYTEQVLEYLEYIGYPEYVLEFSTQDVGRAIGGTCKTFFELDISVRLCALSIFGLTWENQVTNISGRTVQ